MDEMKLHGSARTTRDMRRAIQSSSGSIARVAREFNVDPKTVAKWRHRPSVEDAPMGPRIRGPRDLEPIEEHTITAFRRRSRFSLDECLYYLREQFPQLTRSTLYRCFLRHGLNRIADCAGGMSGDEICALMRNDMERMSRETLDGNDFRIAVHNFLFGTRL